LLTGCARLRAAKEARHFLQRALGSGQTDALKGWIARGEDESFQAFDGNGKVRATLGGDERMYFVDDYSLDMTESFRGVRGKQEIEGLGGGDEDLSGVAAEPRALFGGGVASADADLRDMCRDARLLSHVGDAGERRTQVALNINRKGLERRDVDDAGPGADETLAEHELVQTPEECGKSLAGAGRRQNEGRFAPRYGWPAVALGRCGLVEDRAEPAGGDRMEEGQRINLGRFGRLFGRGNAPGWLRVGRSTRHSLVVRWFYALAR